MEKAGLVIGITSAVMVILVVLGFMMSTMWGVIMLVIAGLVEFLVISMATKKQE